MNTFGPHKPSRRWTWHSLGGEYHNQIDYIMIKRRFQSSVNIAHTRSFPGSDHELVMMTFALRLKKNKKRGNIRIKFDVDKLKDPNILTTFQANIGGRFAPLPALDNDQDLTFDDLAETFRRSIKTTRQTSCREEKWMTDEILALCDQSRSLKKRKKEPESGKQYRERNLKVKRSIKEATEKWIEDQYEEIKNSLKHNNSNKAYKIVKELTGTKQARATTIESKEGKCLTEEKKFWKDGPNTALSYIHMWPQVKTQMC
ncbi:endonuclease-reverse transcriptase [Plakobranchus ocellatus]|uniref:Endonuclease-reverse transcriptase n=1 Tax=Plakobranchus ocellatus TaxID=259542 RepID=A0AAV4CNJ8_9GAST|nr:endonuclease-reverse transcriptase [Plakobranchus ocellatus]